VISTGTFSKVFPKSKGRGQLMLLLLLQRHFYFMFLMWPSTWPMAVKDLHSILHI